MSGVVLIVVLIIVAIILYIIWKIVSFLFFPALIIFAIAYIIYHFSGVNIFKGFNKDNEKKDNK